MIGTWLIRIKIVKKINKSKNMIILIVDLIILVVMNDYCVWGKSIPNTRECIEIEISCKIVVGSDMLEFEIRS